VVLWVGAGVLAGLLLGVAAVMVFTRTDFGMERVRGYALDALQERVQGEVRIERIGGPGLLGAAVFHGVAIDDERGRPFLRLDSARVAYNWRSLVRGRIVLDRATLYGPRLVMEQLPADTAWNYQRIFADTTAATGPDTRDLVMFDDVRVVDGTVIVRMPYEAEEGEERGRKVIEEVPGGLVQVYRFDQLQGEFPEVIWESPLEDGQLFRVASLSGRGFVMSDPVLLRDLRGSVTLVDTVLSLDLPEVELTESRGAVVGRVVMEEGLNRYDVRIDASRLSFADLRWLAPDLPDGGGSLVLRIQTQAEGGLLWLAQDARVTAPGSSVTGTVGFVTGDEPYFTQVDLRAAPLDLDLIARFLPDGLPVEGLAVGTVEVTGPISALETSGSMRLTSPGGTDAGRVRWAGTLDARAATLGARRFHADLTAFDLAFVGSPGGVPGRVDGTVDASGTLRGGLQLDGDLRHRIGLGPASTVRGGGTVRRERTRTSVELLFEGRPLSMQGLAPAFPELERLRGDLAGTLAVRGELGDLALDARIETPGGNVLVGGRMGRSRDGPHLVGEGSVSALRLDELSSALPASTVSGRFTFDLLGSSAATLTGAVHGWLDDGQVAGLALERGVLAVRLDGGMAAVDSLRVVTPAGTVWAEGDFALVEDRSGTLRLGASSADLGPLAGVLYPDELPDPLAPPLVAGRLDAAATLQGGLGGLTADGTATLLEGRGAGVQAERLELTFGAVGVGTDSLRADARAEGFAMDAWGHALPGAVVTGRWADGRAELGARATGSAGEVLRVAGDVAPVSQVAPGADAYALHVGELVLGTPGRAWALQGGATARLAETALELDSLTLAREDGRGVLRGAGRLAWSGTATPAGPGYPRLDFHAEVQDLRVADWFRLTAADADLTGSLSGAVAVTGSPGAPVMRASVRAADLRYEDALVERVDGTFSYADRRVEGSLSAVHQGRRMVVGSGTVPLDLRLLPVEERRLAEPLEFAARVDSLPAAMLLGLVDGFRDVSGWVHGDVRAAGTTLEPELGGALALRSAAAVFDPLGVRFGYVNGFFRVEPTGAVAVDLTVQGTEPLGASRPPGQSLGTVRGVVDLSQLRDPELDLTLTAAELLAVSRRDVQAVVSGQLTVGGRYSRPEVAGALRVDQGVLDVDELYRQYQVVQLETPLLFAAVDTNLVAVRQFRTLSPFLRNLRVDSLVVSVGSDAWLRGRDINVELAGDLNVSLDRQTEDIRLTGTLTAERGTYQLYYGLAALARRFDIREGTVEFPGTPGIDPNLDMTASYRVRRSGDEPLDVQAVVSGSLQAPRVRLTSSADPPISESDLASYLFFGVPTYALRGYANTNASAEGRNMAGLGGQLLAPTAYGLFSTGLQSLSQSLGFFDYVGLRAAEAVPGQDFLANTQLEIGFYVTPDVFISYEQRLASREPGVRLEWRASQAFTAEIFAEDRFARAAGSFGLGQAIAPRRVYGFLLFREWGY